MPKANLVRGFSVALLLATMSGSADAQAPVGTAFTYQGQLKSAGQPANGAYDVQLSLYDGPDGAATLIAGPICVDGVEVSDGLFTVSVDFGAAAFTGSARWLDISLRSDEIPSNCDVGAYTALTPRQPLSAAPYALYALSAPESGWATNGTHVHNTNGGNVGIGTDSPLRRLHVNGEGGASINGIRVTHPVEGSNWDLVVGGSSNSFPGGFAIADEGAARVVVSSNGNVGVGTTTPSQRLSVNGTIESVTGGFRFPDGSVQISAAGPLSAIQRTPQQIALLRWYDANQTGQSFSVGSNPRGIAFDGANIWVANRNGNTVTKLRASDGASLGAFAVGGGPFGVAFDGANVWVARESSDSVTKLRASDGANLGSFPVGQVPLAVVFDGANIWVANAGSDNVMKLRATDGANLGAFPVGNGPRFLAFDGANVWVSNQTNQVRKLRASDGESLGSFPVYDPYGLAFDGANVWVANGGSDDVTKLRAADGANLGSFTVGADPRGVAFDGVNVWVVNQGDNNVTKLRAADGASLGTFPVGDAPYGVAFDGANIWITNSAGSVSKL